jgi:CRISPR/Cas system-associated endoribonuclease Cas2
VRTRYVVTYDVSDPGRLRQVYRVMRGFGDHIQQWRTRITTASAAIEPRPH